VLSAGRVRPAGRRRSIASKNRTGGPPRGALAARNELG
jgi:hypothetical protein